MEQHDLGNGGPPRPFRTVVLDDESLQTLQGFVQLPIVVLKHPALSHGAKIAFGVLLSYAWQEDFCWPAQERLAKDTACSVRQVQRLLNELRDARLIDWKVQGLNRPNVYHILPLSRWIFKKPLENKDTTNMSYPDTTYPSAPDRTKMSYKVDSKEIDTHTRGVSPGTPKRGEGGQPLLEYFRQRAGHTTAQKPLAKELEQAQELVSEHGGPKARWIVAFALEKASETNFRMRHFGGVLSYVPDALLAYEAEQMRKERELEAARRREQEERQLEGERAARQRLTPAERLEKDLEHSLQFFPIKHRRKPSPEDVERLRSELAEKYGLATETGDASRA